MGMAASQARYIELAARKTNVEYEGQQINQQRTALANESAGLFNSMLQMQVPTAPNYANFTKVIYSFSDGTNDYTIDSIAKRTGDPEYNCNVNYYTTVQEYTGMYKERSDLELHSVSKTDENTGETMTIWYYGTKKLDPYDVDKDEAACKQIYLDTVENKKDKTMKDSYVGKNYNAGETGKIYKYSSGGTTYYLSLDNSGTRYRDTIINIEDNVTTLERTNSKGEILDTWTRDTEAGDSIGKVFTTYTGFPIQNCYAATIEQKQWQNSVPAYIYKDDSGNNATITLENYSNTFDLSIYQETDEKAYDQAMNDYVYKKMVYDKSIADINAKTEIIQQEDRTLELKLKQLDTEHNALQTEMDAVKKVCDKNVEDTFKTFA